jgi:hypothetical protein
MMKVWLWLVLAWVGLGVMVVSYTTRARPDPRAPWASGLIAIGPELPAEMAKTGRATRVRLRLLPANDRTEFILKAISMAEPTLAAPVEFALRPKLVVLPLADAGIVPDSLASGRLPQAGQDEILAGPGPEQEDQVKLGDRALQVVGILKRDFVLFRDNYLIHPSDSANGLLPKEDTSVHEATLLQLAPEQLRDRHFLESLAKNLPAKKYSNLVPQERLERETYYLYLAGLAAFLLGGSGTLIGLLRWAAGRARPPSPAALDGDLSGAYEPEVSKARPSWWAVPLLEIAQRPRLLWGVHLVYFGTAILGSFLIYQMPDVQAVLLLSVRGALAAPSGPLAAAAKAYASGSIPRAAAVTFIVNFFGGALLSITVPSMIVPGSGVLIAALRSVLWGVILAPTYAMLALGMLPHSGTMLLEGEGYILATFFALLIPIHMCQSSLGGNPLSRFGRVLLLNIQASALVALVLAVAACYEATEVILMNR